MANRDKMLASRRINLQHVDSLGYVTDLTFGGLSYWDQNTGLGMAPIKRLTEQGPLQNGVTDIGFRLEQRTINIVLTLTGHSRRTVETKQDRLYSLFKPSTGGYSLRFNRAKGVVRQIDCHTTQGPDFSSSEESEGQCAPIFKAGIQVYAPNPIFYDPVQLAQSFGLAGGGGAWAIPWAIPWSIGSSLIDQTAQIPYGGQWEEYPIITIVGPITDAIITNSVSGDKISFVGSTISTGETYTIDLRPGKKSIIDANGTNQIAKLADGSNLATWSLLPPPNATSGINPIRVQGSSVSTLTQVLIQYYNRFIGGR